MSFIAYILEFKTNKYSINYVDINLFFCFVVLIKYQSLKNLWVYWPPVRQRQSDTMQLCPASRRWRQTGHMGCVSLTGKIPLFLPASAAGEQHTVMLRRHPERERPFPVSKQHYDWCLCQRREHQQISVFLNEDLSSEIGFHVNLNYNTMSASCRCFQDEAILEVVWFGSFTARSPSGRWGLASWCGRHV